VLASLTSSITSFIGDYGVYAVFVLMAIDAVFPAASELVMLYAGAVAAGVFGAAHHVSLFGAKIGFGAGAFVAMALAGTLGYAVGGVVGWWIGLRGGRPLLERRGRWLHVTPERLDRAERWFERWEGWAVLIGRVTPIVRSFISIPAGIFRAPLGRYTALTLVGSAVWCFALAGVGWGAGSSWERFHHDFGYIDRIVGVVVAAGVVWLAWKLIKRRRRGSADGPGYTGRSG
jgi:membrane protein DedA with SNARE-associated domain